MTASFETNPKKVITTIEDFKKMIEEQISADYASGEVDDDTHLFEEIVGNPKLLEALFTTI